MHGRVERERESYTFPATQADAVVEMKLRVLCQEYGELRTPSTLQVCRSNQINQIKMQLP